MTAIDPSILRRPSLAWATAAIPPGTLTYGAVAGEQELSGDRPSGFISGVAGAPALSPDTVAKAA